MDQQIGKQLKSFTDYASKESLGQVHAGGFLHHSIRMNPDGTSTAPPSFPIPSANSALPKPGESIWQSFLRARNVP
jgi:hypothetical protein